MLVALITAVAMVATVALLARDARSLKQSGEERLRGRIVPTLLFFAFQAFIGVYAAIGMVESDMLSAIVFNAVFSARAYLGLHRELVVDRLRALTSERGRFPHPWSPRPSSCWRWAGACATLALEMPEQPQPALDVPAVPAARVGDRHAVPRRPCFRISQRRAGCQRAHRVLLLGLGLAEHFVITFKSMPIAPGDLSALVHRDGGGGHGLHLHPQRRSACTVSRSGPLRLLQPRRRALAPRIRALAQGSRAHGPRGMLCLVCVGAHVTMIDYYNS